MPVRSKISQLPEDVATELDAKLLASGFSDMQGLSDWLKGKGFEISKTSVNNYSQDFEARMGALRQVTRQAQAIVAESPDEVGAVNDALIRLVQEKVFSLLLNLEVEMQSGDVAKITRAIADLSRASISQKRLIKEIREEERQRAAELAVGAAKKAGASEELRAQIAEILGG